MINLTLLKDIEYIKDIMSIRNKQQDINAKVKNCISGKDIIQCKCGKYVTLNGLTSHKKVCNFADESKETYIRKLIYSLRETNDITCLVCGKAINICFTELRKFPKNLATCSKECSETLMKFESQFKKIRNCEICGMEFLALGYVTKTCSEKCKAELCRNTTTNYHHSDDFFEAREKRKINLKNSVNSGWRKKGEPSWNSGLKGDEYLNHYLNEDGTSRLKQVNIPFNTDIEIKFSNILNDLNLKYDQQFTFKYKHYDFYIELNNVVLIVEVDGEYWHCHSSKCNDLEKIKLIRNYDKHKETLVENWKRSDRKNVFCLRFWGSTVHELTYINIILNEIIENDQKGNINEINNIVQKNKEYYIKNS